MGGKSLFFDDKRFVFPKPLLEIQGKTMIQHVIEYLNKIEGQKRFIFIINQQDADKYHLDNVVALLTDESSVIIHQQGDTKGAVCSALLAIDYIDTDAPLVISNADQIIDAGVNEAIAEFRGKGADGGAICFESVHPQWSYVFADPTGLILETAEKRPISRNAIAGFYFYKHGRDFVRSAMRCIEKDVNVQGRYFISMAFNEMILEGKSIRMVKIPNSAYHSFYSPEKIDLFERMRESVSVP
jgi:dTDP-glucose pyrophosphorylase